MIELTRKCDGPGSKGPGGVCDCSKLEGWAKGKWPKTFCDEGKCFAQQSYDGCKNTEKVKYRDGKWCANGMKTSSCVTIHGKTIKRLTA